MILEGFVVLQYVFSITYREDHGLFLSPLFFSFLLSSRSDQQNRKQFTDITYSHKVSVKYIMTTTLNCPQQKSTKCSLSKLVFIQTISWSFHFVLRSYLFIFTLFCIYILTFYAIKWTARNLQQSDPRYHSNRIVSAAVVTIQQW